MTSGSIPACLAVFGVGLCFGQTPPQCVEFEVASVKAAPALDASKAVAFGRRIDGAQVRFTQTSLRDLVRIAWAVRDYQIEAAAWVASARFNVSAKLPEGCTQKQAAGMLQALLIDRFGLRAHHGSKNLPVYWLVVRGSGLKMKTSPMEQAGDESSEQVSLAGGGGRGGVVDYGGGSYFALPHYRMEGRKLTMTVFAGVLAALTNRPVIDQTGLSARYDFDVELTGEDYDAMMTRAAISIGEAQSPNDLQQLAAVGDPVPGALRGLGLDLKAGKGNVEVLIVDDARKDPAEN